MKTRALAVAFVAFVAVCARGQGVIVFITRGGGVDAPAINAVTGQPVGSDHLAQLYYGPDPDHIHSTFPNPPARFSDVRPGYVLVSSGGGNRYVDPAVVAPGAVAWFQVRAWAAVLGSTWEEALANWHWPEVIGVSSPVAATTSPTIIDPPRFLFGLQPFRLEPPLGTVPEPGVLALGVLGLAALLWRRRRFRMTTRLSAVVLAALVTRDAQGQGGIVFTTYGGGVNAQVINDLTGRPVGSDFMAQLYYAAYDAPWSDWHTFPNPPARFSDRLPGYILVSSGGGNRYVDPAVVPPGAVTWFQVRVWEAVLGSSWEEALANFHLPRAIGRSESFATRTSADILDPPKPLLGLQSFHLTPIPEPGVLALGLIGLSAVLWRRRKLRDSPS